MTNTKPNQSFWITKSSAVNKSKFSLMPDHFINDPRLNGITDPKLVLLLIRAFHLLCTRQAEGTNETLPLTRANFSAALGVGERRVYDILKMLNEWGYVSHYKGKFNGANIYILHLPESEQHKEARRKLEARKANKQAAAIAAIAKQAPAQAMLDEVLDLMS